MAVGSGLTALLAIVTAGGGRFPSQGHGVLPDFYWLWYTLSPLHYLSMAAHRVAWMTLDAAFIAGLLVGLRLLVRHTLAAAAIGIAVLTFLGAIVWGFMTLSDAPMWIVVGYTALGCLAIVVLYTRVGILAGIAATFVMRPYQLFATGWDSWYASYGVADLLILVALAAYGFWVSLAGRPIFGDMLVEVEAGR